MCVTVEDYASNTTARNRIRIIYENLPNDVSSILDIGCTRYPGSYGGREVVDLHGFLVNEINAEVKGIDLNKKGIKEMKREGYDVVVADAQTYELNESFDAIVAGEVIEYLPNPGLFMENSLDHLRDEGVMIITTENPRALVYWWTAIHYDSNLLKRAGIAIPDQIRIQPNVLWVDPGNLADLSERVADRDIDVEWIPPEGGVSGLLWRLGYQQAAAPRYCAVITKSR